MKTFSFLALYGLATITFATLNDLPDIPDLDPVTQTDQTCQTFYGTRSLNYVPTYTSNGCTTTITAPTYVTTFDTTTSTPDPTSSKSAPDF